MSICGDGAILVVDGISSDLCRLVLAQTELAVESERCQRAHSTSSVAAMA
jgi:hypothetical protein